MADFLDQFQNRPTRIILRSDSIENWLSTNSTPLMYGEIGVGYDANGTNVIAKIGAVKSQAGQSWADAPQISASADNLGLDLEKVGRVYSSVVVDSNNKPVINFTRPMFYPHCSSVSVSHVYGDLATLPHSLKCGTDQTPPDGNTFVYSASFNQRNYIIPDYISGWRETASHNDKNGNPNIFDAPVGFVHPEFDNILPCSGEGLEGDNPVINKLPIQPIQAPLSVLAWLEDVEMWTIPISISEDGQQQNVAMKYLGKVSGWFPFPHREFLCNGEIYSPGTDGFSSAYIDCDITLSASSATIGYSTTNPQSFDVSVLDDVFNCSSYPAFCEDNDICETCEDWDAVVVQGQDWLTIQSVNRTPDCTTDPSTGSVYYLAELNTSVSNRVGVIRVFITPPGEEETPRQGQYQDFTVTQNGQPCKVEIAIPNFFDVPFNSTQTRTVEVLTNSPGSCTYDVTSNVSWITIGTIQKNQFDFTTEANIDTDGATDPRTGILTITENGGGQQNTITVVVAQQGNECIVETVAPTTESFDWNDSSTFTVDFTFSTEDDPICTWTANLATVSGNFADASWVTITANASGTGSETVEYQAAVNPSIQDRQAKLSVLGTDHDIEQTLRPCTITYFDRWNGNDNPQEIANCGGTIILEVRPYSCGSDEGCVEPENCSWTVDLSNLGTGTAQDWLNVIAVGTNPDNLTDLPGTIINGVGYIKLEAQSTCGETCDGEGDSRTATVYVIPVNDLGTEPISYPAVDTTVSQACGLPDPDEDSGLCCSCTEDECGEENPCDSGSIYNCEFYYYNEETGQCECACDANGTPPTEAGLCCCPGSGNDIGNCDLRCAPPEGDNPASLIGYTITLDPDQSGLVDIPGIIEVDVTKIANSFVKVKGFLNPGVSPIWDAENNTWVPKNVPNFYSNQLQGLEGQGGYVYYDINDSSWKISNVIDGGGAF